MTDINIGHLANCYSEFLKSVYLCPFAPSPSQGQDGLFQFNINADSEGHLTINHRNIHGPHLFGDDGRVWLHWQDAGLETVIEAAVRLSPKISKRLISKYLRQVTVRLFEDHASEKLLTGLMANAPEEGVQSFLSVIREAEVSTHLTAMIGKLRSQVADHEVFIPVEGLNLKGTLEIGDVGFFCTQESDEAQRLIELMERRYGDSGFPEWHAVKSSDAIAKMTIEGDDYLVRSEAIIKIRQVLHVINYCLSSTSHQPSWTKTRLANVVLNVVCFADGDPSANIAWDYASPIERPLSLTRPQLREKLLPIHQRLARAGVLPASDFRERDTRLTSHLEHLSMIFQTTGKIANRIQRSITWYSKAVDADTREEQFVNLAIALECLLVGNEGKGPFATTGSISQKLGERTAFLLHTDLELRLKQEKLTKKLYGFRSAIVHKGESITTSQLEELDGLVKDVISAFHLREFRSWEHFLEWVAIQKYTNIEQKEQL